MNVGNRFVALLLFIAAPALAEEPDVYTRALAAGYKAQFLCSGVFSAGRDPGEIEGNELARIYPELRGSIGDLEPVIAKEARTVSVKFAPDMPPRIAAWRRNLGCAALPIGAAPEAARYLPRFDRSPPAYLVAPKWPLGDVGAVAKPAGDARLLAAAVAHAFDHRTYGAGTETSAVLVVQSGRIVAERYRDGFDAGTPQRSWSVAKSIAGTMLGIAAHKGLIDIAAPAPVPEWQAPGDPRAAITTENLMRMASGLHSDFAGNRTDAIYFGGTSVTENVPGQPLEAKPGTRFRYANDDILLAVRGLRAAIGNDDAYLAFPFTDLLWKLGMNHTFPETDWRGNFVLSSQVWTTSRDLARLGLLYLNDGVWNGERVLPEGFARFVATLGPAQPDDRPFGYGATFWVARPAAKLPAGTFAAMGNRGQYLVIVPSRNILVVRRGFDAVGDGERFDIARFTADVLRALD